MTAAQKKGEKIILDAEKREVFGKKLHILRKAGKIPANIFGKGFTSTAITVDHKEFTKTFRSAGETQVVYLHLGKEEIPALVADLHIHPVTDDFLHIDFRKVDLKQKTEAEVPVVLVGEADAVVHKKGDLLHLMDTLTVEALPSDIPSEIEIDITGLSEIDDAIKVSDIKPSKDFVIQDDPETIIVKIAEHKEEDLEPATVEEAPEEGAEAEAGEAPTPEGESSGEEKAGEAPAEE
jgi:large subunit ribosomal protein L25